MRVQDQIDKADDVASPMLFAVATAGTLRSTCRPCGVLAVRIPPSGLETE